MARHDAFRVPHTKRSLIIAEILEKNGYIKGIAKKGRTETSRFLELKISYDENGRPVFSDFKLVSKPSRRLYAGYKDFKPVKSGYGHLVVSTPQGIMTSKEARKQKAGGELLFEIW